MTKGALLFLIIFIEGYVVLACELLAIRQLIPFVGSGTETISLVISAVLLPLAVGYHQGGLAWRRQYRRARSNGKRVFSVRQLLLRNIVGALLVLTLGLSSGFMEILFGAMTVAGIGHRLPQTAVYCLLFLVSPIYKLGQTVPLVSHYFSHNKLSEITGKMLFFSTAGSFLGSVFSTIVLMMVIGVHMTVIVTLSLLIALIFLLVRRLWTYEVFLSLCIFALLLALNGAEALRVRHIVSDNAYNTVAVIDLPEKDTVVFNVNRSSSSLLDKDGKKSPYIEYLESILLQPSETPRDILVIGAGGFTFGLNDDRNRFTFVDIDPAIRKAAEEHFLPEKLSANKTFIPESARAFVRREKNRYDAIVIDVYTNMYSVPMEAVTREFLQDVKKLLKENGVLAVNMASSPIFDDAFTVRYHNTFASVFPVFTRQIVGEYTPWPKPHKEPLLKTALYFYYHRPLADDRTIYTDDRNTYSVDR